MKNLSIERMENLNGGYCTKTTTMVLLTAAGGMVSAATGNIFWTAVALYEIADTIGSGECENW